MTRSVNTSNSAALPIFLAVVMIFIYFIYIIFFHKKKNNRTFAFIDKFKSIDEVQAALRNSGLESSSLILGIDYTKSNEESGMRSFGGRSLHAIISGKENPYQQVIRIIGNTLSSFDDDQMIPVFGFGDSQTKDKTVFPFYPDHTCYTFNEVLSRYNEITPLINLSGPTSFAPLIYAAISIIKETKDYHILVIIADGQVNKEKETIDAIVEASNYPLSIIMVGVGDGPWDTMKKFDDKIPERKFDNFQFVEFNAVMNTNYENKEAAFAMNALMEIPDQYKLIQKLHIL